MMFQKKIVNPLYAGQIDTDPVPLPANTTGLSMNQGRCIGWQIIPDEEIITESDTVEEPKPYPDEVADWHANAPLPELPSISGYQTADHSPEEPILMHTGKSNVEPIFTTDEPQTEPVACEQEYTTHTNLQPSPPLRPKYVIHRAVWGGCYYYRRNPNTNGYSLHVPFNRKTQTF